MATIFKTIYRRPRLGQSASNPSKLELREAGRIVVDGVEYDYRAAADYNQDAWLPSNYLAVTRTTLDWTVRYLAESDAETLPAETETNYADADLPAYPVWPDGETQAAQTIDSTDSSSLTAISDLQKQKNACYLLLGAFAEWARQLNAEGVAHPASETQIGHDFLVYAHWGLYHVMVNHPESPGNSNGITKAQKAAWAQTMAQGAADCTTAREFFEQVHSLTSAQTPGADTPVMWVNPSDAVRWNLADIVSNSATEFAKTIWDGVTLDVSNVDIRGGAWIESLT